MITRISKFLTVSCAKLSLRNLSSKAQRKHHLEPGVYVSTCYDVFYNLAFETWVYENVAFSDDDEVCFLWRNDPCVVIGRHQNPWTECRVLDTASYGVRLARRASGGGTVYHDRGNLNVTFFTSRQRHNRKRNLAFIVDALKADYNLPLSLNSRDDIICNERFKVSGTAAKLGAQASYHHCTLLVDANLDLMRKLISTAMAGIGSKATESVRSSVTQLSALQPSLTAGHVLDCLAQHYNAAHNTSGLTYIDPTKDASYPGILQFYDELKSWQWIFGKTPNFTLVRDTKSGPLSIELKLTVEKGCIRKVDVRGDFNDINSNKTAQELSELLTNFLANEQFWPSSLHVLLALHRPLHANHIIERLVLECFDQIFTKFV